jgi:hypothetical protein
MIIDGVDYWENVQPPTIDYGTSTIGVVLPKLEHGSHLIELYATSKGKGNPVPSNSVFYDVIWWDDITPETDTIIASSFL